MKELSKYIDHTLLRANATSIEIQQLCQEAIHYGFAAVCVNGCHAQLASQLLVGSQVKTCVVVGFPLGAASTEAKVAEARDACAKGAAEIDMVINIGSIKDGNHRLVREDIQAVVSAVNQQAIVKVILETCLLTEEEKIKACQLAVAAGAGYVKTSTGFGCGGATVEDVRLMKQCVGKQAKVKASGGIHNYDQAMAMIIAGADRLGTSRGIAIMEGWQRKG